MADSLVKAVLASDITEIGRCSSAQASSLRIALDRLDLGHGRAESLSRLFLVNVHGTLVCLALGDMCEPHVVRDGVHNPSLGRSQVGGENNEISGLVLLEKQ